VGRSQGEQREGQLGRRKPDLENLRILTGRLSSPARSAVDPLAKQEGCGSLSSGLRGPPGAQPPPVKAFSFSRHYPKAPRAHASPASVTLTPVATRASVQAAIPLGVGSACAVEHAAARSAAILWLGVL
jgi:hypothetical protein